MHSIYAIAFFYILYIYNKNVIAFFLLRSVLCLKFSRQIFVNIILFLLYLLLCQLSETFKMCTSDRGSLFCSLTNRSWGFSRYCALVVSGVLFLSFDNFSPASKLVFPFCVCMCVQTADYWLLSDADVSITDMWNTEGILKKYSPSILPFCW